MVEVEEKRIPEDNFYRFKRLASYNPRAYNGALDPKAFKDWIPGME